MLTSRSKRRAGSPRKMIQSAPIMPRRRAASLMEPQPLAHQHRAEEGGEARHDGEDRALIEAAGVAQRLEHAPEEEGQRRAEREVAGMNDRAGGSVSPSRQATMGAMSSAARTKRMHISTAGSRPWVMCSPRGNDVEMMTMMRKASACACAWPVRAGPPGSGAVCGDSCAMPHPTAWAPRWKQPLVPARPPPSAEPALHHVMAGLVPAIHGLSTRQ